jgi:hypothetical protein
MVELVYTLYNLNYYEVKIIEPAFWLSEDLKLF